MNKTKLAIIGGTMALLLTTGIIAYSKAADSTNSSANAPNTKQAMLDGAVQKGVISQEQADNLKTYAKEQRTQMMQDRLGQAVKDGIITQDEANQIKSWHDSRPAALDKLGKGFGRGFMHGK